MVKVTESGMNRSSPVSYTLMQNLMVITFMEVEKITMSDTQPVSQPASRSSTDHYVGLHFSCESEKDTPRGTPGEAAATAVSYTHLTLPTIRCV